MTLILILSATFLVSLISLAGVFTLWIKRGIFDRLLVIFVGFATGALIGGAFLHLLPEAVEKCEGGPVFLYVLIGFVAFFFMERYFYWRHCHEGECDIHAFTYLNLIGDGIHNFIDGLIIAASFVADIKLGAVTTLAVIFHEVPQEIGDFAILVYGGFTRARALFFNFVCGLTAMLGAIAGYVISNIGRDVLLFLIPFTAGGFIYIAGSDLIPELHKEKNKRRANFALLTFILGIAFMAAAKFVSLH